MARLKDSAPLADVVSPDWRAHAQEAERDPSCLICQANARRWPAHQEFRVESRTSRREPLV